MKNIITLSLLALACSSGPDQEPDSPKSCNQPDSYTATYTKVSGNCGSFETESFDQDDMRTWFPLALDLDDCVRATECDDGILNGSSYCTRATTHAEGTLDAKLVFDTKTNTGTIDLVISAVNYHGSSTCESVYNVSYNAECYEP